MAAGERLVLHADMDAFYASIEQRDHPELRGQPVIVGATSPRGVVAAASYEARSFGVRSAMPGFEARRLCPEGHFVAADIRRYSEVSDQVHEVFQGFTDQMEPLALDEAFLDVTGSIGLFGGVLPLARELKQRVWDAVGLPVSVGIAPNKLVAKIACALSKPNGLLWVPPHAVQWLLRPLPVRRLWGVGPKLAAELNAHGIRRVGQLADEEPRRLEALLGSRASALVQLARGVDPRPVEGSRVPKSYGEENTFERDVSATEIVESTITAHAEAVARRLRRDGYVCRTVTLKVKLAQRKASSPVASGVYPLISRSRSLVRPTADGATLRAVSVALWHSLAQGSAVRLIGVSASQLEPASRPQLELFESNQPGLGGALDAINERFGLGTIRRAVLIPPKLTPTQGRKPGE